ACFTVMPKYAKPGCGLPEMSKAEAAGGTAGFPLEAGGREGVFCRPLSLADFSRGAAFCLFGPAPTPFWPSGAAGVSSPPPLFWTTWVTSSMARRASSRSFGTLLKPSNKARLFVSLFSRLPMRRPPCRFPGKNVQEFLGQFPEGSGAGGAGVPAENRGAGSLCLLEGGVSRDSGSENLILPKRLKNLLCQGSAYERPLIHVINQ